LNRHRRAGTGFAKQNPSEFPTNRGNMTIWNWGGGVLIMNRWSAVFVPQSCHVLTRKVPMSRRPTAMNASAANGPPAPRQGDDNNNNKRRGAGAPGTAVITKTKPQTKRPNLYRVLLLNDDYTPMEFVVHVLERFFNKDHGTAHRIMMHVHQHGIGECGIYTYEVAETKVTQVMDFARKHQHPLQCVMEKK
jgi:ATP-dependent Clp protease adaptor protein ClpS